jgi:hypothetical protein
VKESRQLGILWLKGGSEYQLESTGLLEAENKRKVKGRQAENERRGDHFKITPRACTQPLVPSQAQKIKQQNNTRLSEMVQPVTQHPGG